MRLVFAYVFGFVPMSLKRIIARRIYKWGVHRAERAHRAPRLHGPRRVHRGRNVITNLNELRLAEGANIGSGNMIKGWWDHPTEKLPERNPSVYLAAHAQIASYHSIDCVDSPELGRHAAIPASGPPCSRTRST